VSMISLDTTLSNLSVRQACLYLLSVALVVFVLRGRGLWDYYMVPEETSLPPPTDGAVGVCGGDGLCQRKKEEGG
jgi:hypothetical protein